MPAVQAFQPKIYAHAKPTVQRVALDIGKLDTDNMEQIEQYIAEKLSEGRKDLIGILKQRVELKEKDPEKLTAFRDMLERHADQYKAPKTEAVPQQIHVIWMGDKIKEAAYNNIVELHKGLKPGWKLTLWTDSNKSGFLNGSPGSELEKLAKIDDNFEIKTVDNIIDGRITKTYQKALDKNAYSMASDLARYSILSANGGIYMDVDLGIGDADLSTWNMQIPEHGLPALGPNLRDKDDREKTLESGLMFLEGTGDLKADQQHQGDLKAFVHAAFDKMFSAAVAAQNEEIASKQTIETHKTLPDKDKTGVAARVKYMQGLVSNQFIAVPPNHAFINYLLDSLKKSLEDSDKEWDPQQVAALTGPSKFSTVIAGYYKDRDLVQSIQPDEKHNLLDPVWTSQISKIQWLTAESENQLGKVEEVKSEEGASVIPVVASVAVLALAIGIAYYVGRQMKFW